MRVSLLLLVACAPPEPEPADPTCNGWLELCDRTLLELAIPATHNSHSSYERAYEEASANHVYAIPTQLADGIRALNVDVYEVDGEMLACHGYCDFGSQPLSEVWVEITDFLDAHPREVVSLWIQDGTQLDSLLTSFREAGMDERAYVHEGEWPTLEQMIEADTRLVIAGRGGGADAPWYNDENSLRFATDYGYPSVDAIDCELRNTPFDGGLFVVAHTFLDPIAWEALSVEGNPRLPEHVALCEQQHGQQTNILAVDWYHHGDVVGVAAAENGVDPTTRQTPTVEDLAR